MKRLSYTQISNQVSLKYCMRSILAGYRVDKEDDLEKIRPVMLKHRQTMFKIYDGNKNYVIVYIIANPSGLDFQFVVSCPISPIDHKYWDVWFMRDSKGTHEIQHSFPQFSHLIQERIKNIYYMALEIYGHKIEDYVNISDSSKENMLCAFLDHFYNASDDADCSFKLDGSMVRFQKKDNSIWFTFPDGYSCRLEYARIISYYVDKLELRATYTFAIHYHLAAFIDVIYEWLEFNTSFKPSSQLPEELNKKYARAIRAYHEREKAMEEIEQERLEESLRQKKEEEAWERQREENTKNRVSPYNIDAMEKARQENTNMI